MKALFEIWPSAEAEDFSIDFFDAESAEGTLDIEPLSAEDLTGLRGSRPEKNLAFEPSFESL